MFQLAIKNLSKLAPFAGGPWDLPHKFHLYLIIRNFIYFTYVLCHPKVVSESTSFIQFDLLGITLALNKIKSYIF